MHKFFRKWFGFLGRAVGPDPPYDTPYKPDYLDLAPGIVETSNAASASGPPPGPRIEKEGAKIGWEMRDPDEADRK